MLNIDLFRLNIILFIVFYYEMNIVLEIIIYVINNLNNYKLNFFDLF